MSEQNKAIVRRFVEEVQNSHDLTAVDDLFSPDFVNHVEMLGIPNDLDGAKKFFLILSAAFPDMQMTIHDQISEGDKVVTRKTFHGTHQGEFLGIPATGKHVEMDIIDIFRVIGGKITEHWAEADLMALMQQLGAIGGPK